MNSNECNIPKKWKFAFFSLSIFRMLLLQNWCMYNNLVVWQWADLFTFVYTRATNDFEKMEKCLLFVILHKFWLIVFGSTVFFRKHQNFPCEKLWVYTVYCIDQQTTIRNPMVLERLWVNKRLHCCLKIVWKIIR